MRLRLLAGSAFVALALAPATALAQLTAEAAGIQVSAGGGLPLISQAGRTTDIALGAARTIIPWSSYKLASDQAVVYRFQDRGGIVLNKVTGQAVIDGSIESLVGTQRGGGAVWFSAPGGVIFGPNARVNVGGLLATTGAVSAAGFLDPGNLKFDFTGAGGAAVEVRSGAQVNAAGGALALVAGSISSETDSSVTGTGATVLLGAANEFSIRFVGTTAGDLDLVDFVVPTAAAGTSSTTPLTLRGETVGANVFLAVVNRAEVARAVISAPGLVAAQSATSDRGDVVLTAGVGVINRQPGLTRINTTTETTANLDVIAAQRDLLGGLSSPTALTGQQFAAGRDLGFAAASLDVADLNAGRLLAIDASRGITVRSGATAGASITLRTPGALSVGGGLNALGRVQIDAASVQAGQLNAGRSVVINASGVGSASGPAVRIGAVIADDDIAITTTNTSGHIVLGSATFTALRLDDAPAGRNLTLTARGAQADVTFGAPGGSALIGATKVTLSAGRDVTANVSGLLSLTSGAAGRSFTIRAGDLDIAGPLSAASLRIESLTGGLTLGGGASNPGLASPSQHLAAPSDGMRVTEAEFQKITVTDQVSFYAGAAGSTARGDLTVLDLRVDPARTPALLLAAGPGNDVAVTGALAPGVSGGVVTIGEASADNGFQPGRILISGSIGVAAGSTATSFIDVHALSETHLNAVNEIILGSPRFIGLVSGVPADQIDIAHDLPAGVAPTPAEQGHVFIATGVLTMSAASRIIVQNTGTRTTPIGILIDGGVPDAPPPGTPTLSVSTTGVADLSGSFRDMGGTVRGGLGAGLTPSLVVGGGGGGGSPSYHFNGLDVGATAGGGGSGGGGRLPNLLDARVQVIAQGVDSSLTSPSDAAVNGLPPEAPVLTTADADSDVIALDPVPVSTGSFELWKRKLKRK